MLSPWDEAEQVRVLQDGGSHNVIGIDVLLPSGDDDERISVDFRTATGTLRVRLPHDKVTALARALLKLAERRIVDVGDQQGDDGDDDFPARQIQK
jgi:hypothetical protein